MIEVSHLTKKYGSRLAVDDISFTVEDGVIYGLLGPNGAGKSTIMNILTGYLAATEGQVTVAGHPLPEEADAAKACVGYLPEQPPLYPEMTVAEYLDFAAELKGVKKADRPAQVQSAAHRTGLEEVLPRLIRSLSKGYRQRVGVAQALLGSPQLIILDEPTVGLDPKQIIEIRNLIKKLGDNHTVILSSHILSEVQAVCERILVINQGRIVADGSPDTLSHQMTGNHKLLVRLEGRETELKQGLKTLHKVKEVQPLGEKEPGVFEFTVEGEPGADLRRDLFALASRKGWPILSLRTNDLTLEEVFLRLTDGQAAAAQKEGESA